MFYSSEWNFIKLFILLFHSPKLISRSIHAFSNIQIRLSSYYPFNMMYCIYAYTIYWMKARACMSTRLSERMYPLSPNIRGLAKAYEQTRWQMSHTNSMSETYSRPSDRRICFCSDSWNGQWSHRRKIKRSSTLAGASENQGESLEWKLTPV